MIGTVKTTDKQCLEGHIIHPKDLAWLGNVAKGFDRYKIHSLKYHWRPSVGTTTNGSFAMGVDWDSNVDATKDTYKKTMALSPVFDSPVWQSGTLTLPSNKLQSRKEYFLRGDSKTSDFDMSPGYILLVTEGAPNNTTIGHVWAEYDITLFGTVMQE